MEEVVTRKLKHEPEHCYACPLSRDSRVTNQYITTDLTYIRGAKSVDVLVVGDAAGPSENAKGLPFQGSDGLLYRRLARRAGITSVAYSHVLRCRPTSVALVGDEAELVNRAPTIEEQGACLNYFHKDLDRLKPKVVILAGNQAIQAIAPCSEWLNKSAHALKGQICEKDGITYLATLAPSSAHGVPPEERRLQLHLNSVQQLLSGEATDYSKKGRVKLIQDVQTFKRLIKFLLKKNTAPIAFDFETQNLNQVAENKIATLQLSCGPNLAWTIPIDHWESPWSRKERAYVIKGLRALFRSRATKFQYWIAHNAPFDIARSLQLLDIRYIHRPVIDTMFVAYLQDENQVGADTAGFATFRLKDLARDFLGFRLYDTELSDAMAARSGASGGSLWDLPLDRLSEYGGTDAYVTWRLLHYFVGLLSAENYHTAIPFALKWGSRASHLQVILKKNGFYVDRHHLDYLMQDDSPISDRLAEIPGEFARHPLVQKANNFILSDDPATRGMRPLFGKKPWVFDLAKKGHRVKLFVDACALKPLAYGKDGKPSINKQYFDEYSHHDLIKLYQEYSGLYKLRTSYINSIIELIETNPDNLHDKRVHASFHVIRTVTGRAASSNPNLQQLPSGKPWTAKAQIKSMYGASPGCVIIECDYGQAEVRWWAQLAGDRQYAQLFTEMKKLRDEFRRTGDADLGRRCKIEADIHRKVASIMFQRALEDITDFERKKAKSLCFGAVYGQSTKALALILGIEEHEAEVLQRTFVGEFDRAGNWLTEIEQTAAASGITITPMGRIRHLADVFLRDEGAGQRRARNSPIQAISSDTTMLAAWRIQRHIEENDLPIKLVNVVHDAVYLELPLDYELMADTIHLLNDKMVESLPEFLKEEFDIDMIVPMEIDFDIGLRLGHMLNFSGHMPDLKGIYDKCVEWNRRLEAKETWVDISMSEPLFQPPPPKAA